MLARIAYQVDTCNRSSWLLLAQHVPEIGSHQLTDSIDVVNVQQVNSVTMAKVVNVVMRVCLLVLVQVVRTVSDVFLDNTKIILYRMNVLIARQGGIKGKKKKHFVCRASVSSFILVCCTSINFSCSLT